MQIIYATLVCNFSIIRIETKNTYIYIYKAVILLSIMHDLPELDETTRKPEIILSYNKIKGAVDTMDKM